MNTTTTTNPFSLPLPASAPASARSGLRLLQRLQHGTLHLELPDGSTLQLGQGNQPHASLRLHDWRVFGAVLRSGDIGLAEGYIDQHWSTPHLARIFHRSRATNEDGIALVCPKIQVSNLDQRAGNAEAKLYRRN